jgi:outer membrane protein
MAGASFALLASQAQAQTLESALSQAYTSNPTLNAQRAGTRSFDENVPQALSGYRPIVTATANAGVERDYFNVPHAGNTQDTIYPRGVGLTVTQPLFDGFKTANAVRSAEAGVLSQRETLRDAEQSTLLDAVTAYMNVLRDAALYNLQQSNVEVLQEQLKQTQDRFDVGEVTRTDVEQANASLATARSQEIAAQAQLNASTAVYRQVIGSQPKRLAPAKPLRILPKSQKVAVQQGLDDHPAIMSALHSVDAAAEQVKVAESSLYPTLSAQGSFQQAYQPQDTINRQTSASIGAFLTIPIFQGGAEYSKIRQAKENLGQARIQADVLREQVREAVVQAWGNLDAARSEILANQAGVTAAGVALAGVREEAKVGQRTTFDVLQQQQILLNARASLITAQRDQVVAAYTLLSAVGKLNATALGLKVRRYDPAVHYEQVRNKWIGTDIPDGR